MIHNYVQIFSLAKVVLHSKHFFKQLDLQRPSKDKGKADQNPNKSIRASTIKLFRSVIVALA